MKSIIICVFVFLFNILASWILMLYSGRIALVVGGYFVTLGIIPLIMSLILGCIGIKFLSQEFITGLKNYWWIVLTGMIGAYSPIGYYLWAMSQPGS